MWKAESKLQEFPEFLVLAKEIQIRFICMSYTALSVIYSWRRLILRRELAYCSKLFDLRRLRTFALIVSAYPYCARNSRRRVMHVMH